MFFPTATIIKYYTLNAGHSGIINFDTEMTHEGHGLKAEQFETCTMIFSFSSVIDFWL